MISKFLRPLLVCAAIGGLLIHRPDAVRAVSSGVVISQVYGGGGATTGSPTFKNDYIELFNRGNAPVSLAGMSVQYASATGNFTAGHPIAQRDASAGTVLPRAGRHGGRRLGRHVAHP